MDLRDKFELAEGGTVFLDEIGEMSPYAQVKIPGTTETGLKEDPIEKGGLKCSISVKHQLILA
jgi:transcriptional regulator with GAF, ATPase, and Fis domain